MQDINFKADKEKCIHCTHCVKDCIAGVITMDENNFPRASFPERCIKCGHCFAICPVGAISVFDKNPEESENIIEYNPDSVLNLIKSRRSDRKYGNENLNPDTLKKLKDMLAWVPTGCNYHKLHFSFIDDIEVMNEFRNLTNKKLIEALTAEPAEAAVNKFSAYLKFLQNGEDVIFRGAPHILVVSNPLDAPCQREDAIIALSYFELYAQSLNVGTCWCGFAYACLNIFPELCEYLEIPAGYKPGYVMLFGAKKAKYFRTTQPERADIISVRKKGL